MDDFYIGYQDKAPKSFHRFIASAVGVILLIAALVAFQLVRSQEGFPAGEYELGSQVELEGILLDEPVPMLRVQMGEVHKDILLISFGKFGAYRWVRRWTEEDEPPPWVKLRGTLIYRDGVTLLELTDRENALIDKQAADGFHRPPPEDLGEAALTGQIVDPKCYFGVMKPGEGKIHRSCAVLCISGGIPPVFVAKTKYGQSDYYLLLGPDGQRINQKVLPFVADQVSISGRVEQFEDWYVLKVDPGAGISRAD